MSPQSTPCFIIIVHHGSPQATRQLVTSLLTNSSVPDQIIVIDHGHPDPPLELSDKTSPTVTLIRPPANAGYGSGLMLGLGALVGHSSNPEHDLVLCLNNDVTIHPQTIERLRAWWDHSATRVVAGIRYGYMNMVNGRCYSNSNPFVSRPYLHGAALAGSLKNLARHLPTDYFLYSEDVALSWRAVKAGLYIEELPASLGLNHHDHATPVSDQKMYYLVRNGARVLEQEASLLWRGYWRVGNFLRRLYHRACRHSLITQALTDARRSPTTSFTP